MNVLGPVGDLPVKSVSQRLIEANAKKEMGDNRQRHPRRRNLNNLKVICKVVEKELYCTARFRLRSHM